MFSYLEMCIILDNSQPTVQYNTRIYSSCWTVYKQPHFLKLLSGLILPFFLWKGSHYMAQADLELEILLSQPSKCWDYNVYHHTLLCLAFLTLTFCY
jgi:hypothetical protein